MLPCFITSLESRIGFAAEMRVGASLVVAG